MTPLRLPLAAAFVLATATLAHAGASSQNFNYTPDPGLKTAGKGELQSRIARACTATQARLQNAAQSSLARPCACYASRVMRALDGGELTAYRETGVFNDTARQKALAAIDSCPAAAAGLTGLEFSCAALAARSS